MFNGSLAGKHAVEGVKWAEVRKASTGTACKLCLLSHLLEFLKRGPLIAVGSLQKGP